MTGAKRSDLRVDEMRVLILGSSGFLGSNLLFHMSREPNIKVFGASRNKRQRYKVERYTRRTLEDLIDRLEPTAVINCVGTVGHLKVESNPREAHLVNVELPESLANITQNRGIGFVHFSSDSVYSGKPEDAPFSEESPTQPFSHYGVQKLESESKVRARNPAAVVMRVNFYGWSRNGNSGMLDHFISHGISGSHPIGYADYFASSLYVGELSRVVVAAIGEKISGLFNVGSPEPYSKLAFGREVFKAIGLSADQVIAGNPSIWKAEGISSRNLAMSSNLIESTLGISLLPQLQGITLALKDAVSFLEFTDARQDPRFAFLRGLSQ